jgi:hypothetical protein
MKDLQETAAKQSEARQKRTGSTGSDRASMRERALRGVKQTEKLLREGKEKTLTQAEVRQQIHDLLVGLHGVVGDFGSNYESGQVESHAAVQTMLLRSLDTRIKVANQGQWHPGARYAGSEIAVVGLGVGF